jgi:hypothetical protein
VIGFRGEWVIGIAENPQRALADDMNAALSDASSRAQAKVSDPQGCFG